jgi:hypothetical protein
MEDQQKTEDKDMVWDQKFDEVLKSLRKDTKFETHIHSWLKSQFLNLQNASDQQSKQRWVLMMNETVIQEAYERFCNRKSWGLRFHELKSFIKKFDRLPSMSDEDRGLYNWTRKQITFLKNGKFDRQVPLKYKRINLARKERLLELDLIKYYANNPYNFPSDRWTKRFEELKEFIEINNRLPSEADRECLVNPNSKLIHEFILARWLVVQLQTLRERREWKMSDHKKEKLLSLKLVNQRYIENKYLRKI